MTLKSLWHLFSFKDTTENCLLLGKVITRGCASEGAKEAAEPREIRQISRPRSFSLILAGFRTSSSFTPCSQHGSRQE